jgi:cytochrome c-type biogenesis protein CcmH
MTLWFVLALMTVVAVFAVLWPLARRKPLRPGSDVVVYRDQLDEIARDRASGLIGEPEAEAARIEVSRRLLAAADAAENAQPAPEQPSLWRRRGAAIAGLVLLPAGAVALYLALGSPQLPGEPLAARLRAPEQNQSIESLVAKVEDHVQRNPNDGRAWEVLAPVYMRVGRFDEAVTAWGNAIRLNGSTAARQANFGEAMVAAANGVVTADAKAAFDRAIALDKDNVMARFYEGMAADQDGRRAEAEAIWRDLIATAPPGAPWVELVRHALARVAPSGPVAGPNVATTPQASGVPGPSAADIAAAGKMAPGQQNEFIRNMVARLADELKKDGSNVDGWLRLVRSYRVLGQNDKADAAAADARKALAGDADKLSRFNEGVKTASAAPAAPVAQPPSAPNAPAASTAPTHNQSIAGMVEGLAQRLKKDGSDPNGWLMLVRSYHVLGENGKAQAAIADARKALAGDQEKLSWFEQASKTVMATPLASEAPPSPPTPPAAAPPPATPGPSAADIAAASKMKPDQQNQMIAGMVARLADRLKQNGDDLDGWLRLVRSYVVLGERSKADAAAADARRALAGDPAKVRRIDELAKELGLQS